MERTSNGQSNSRHTLAAQNRDYLRGTNCLFHKVCSCAVSSKGEAGCRDCCSYCPSHWGRCALTPLLFSWLPSEWTVNQITETSSTKQVVWKWLSNSDFSFGLWHNWKETVELVQLKSVNYSRGAGHKLQGKKLSTYSFYSWWKYIMKWLLCPRKRDVSGNKQPSSANSLCYTHTQDRNSGFPAMQYCFFPVHTHLTITGALKGRAGGVFFNACVDFFLNL